MAVLQLNLFLHRVPRPCRLSILHEARQTEYVLGVGFGL